MTFYFNLITHLFIYLTIIRDLLCARPCEVWGDTEMIESLVLYEGACWRRLTNKQAITTECHVCCDKKESGCYGRD